MDKLAQRLIEAAHDTGLYGMEVGLRSRIANSMIEWFKESGYKEYSAKPDKMNFRFRLVSSPLRGDCIEFSWNPTHSYQWNSCLITMAGEIILND